MCVADRAGKGRDCGGLSESQVHKFKASTGGVGYSSVGCLHLNLTADEWFWVLAAHAPFPSHIHPRPLRSAAAKGGWVIKAAFSRLPTLIDNNSGEHPEAARQ